MDELTQEEEIELLRYMVRTFTDGKPWGDCVSIKRSSFGYVRFSDPRKIAVVQRAYDSELTTTDEESMV